MKILITHVPAGSGHEKAAEAIFVALRKIRPEAEVTLLNGLEGMSSGYQWCFTQGYLGLIHRFPFLWGAAYHLADLQGLAWAAYKLHRLSNASHGKILEGIVLRYQPDVFISTHFFPAEVASFLKLRGRLSARLITVITDFLPHNVWICPGTDTYVVGSDVTRKELMARAVEEEKIRVLGIPIDPKFSRRSDRRSLAQRLGVDPERFTVLICSGGFGTGPMEQLFRILSAVSKPLQALIVTGKNTALFHRLKGLRPSIPHTLKIYGFVDNMDELMDVSDLMITKPGGLSCAEAMAKGLPMILASPIPGQEARNAQVVQRIGTAILAQRASRVPSLIQELRSDPARMRAMAQKGREASFPDAASNVARLAVS